MLKKQRDFYHHAAEMAQTQLEMMEKTLRTTPHRYIILFAILRSLVKLNQHLLVYLSDPFLVKQSKIT